MLTNVDDLRNSDGTLATYAWPGGYPLMYLTTFNNRLCPDCANSWQDDEIETIAYGYVRWEGPAEYCDECGAEIESAYGDPAEEDL